MDNEMILEVLLPIVIAIISGVATLIGVYFSYLIRLANKQVQSLEKAEDRKLLYQLLADVEDSIQTAVVRTNQLFVDALKENGLKLTDPQKIEAYERTYSEVISLLGQDAYAQLEKLVPNIKGWMEAKIEFAVNKYK